MTILNNINFTQALNPWQRHFNRLKPSSMTRRATTVRLEVEG
jgi:hypothetical protein